MEVVTYTREQMEWVGKLLNDINIVGVNQARILTEIGNIIDSGKIGEIIDGGGGKDGMERKEIQQD